MTPITKPGVYDKVPPEQYHADRLLKDEVTLSAGVAWTLISRSPAHAFIKHPRLNPDFEPEEKAVFDMGKAGHNMALRQDFWREEIAILDFPDWKKKAAREERDEARAAGKHPVLIDQYERLDKMIGVLEAHPQAGKAFKNGKPEQTFIWQCEETGVLKRARPDWTPNAPGTMFPDYKTTADANPSTWDRRFMLDHGGLLRAAWYEEGIKAACKIETPTLFYVVQEVDPPHSVVVRIIDPDSEIMKIGRAMVRKATHLWADCLDKNEWPTYPFTGTLILPGWAENQWSVEYADWMPKAETASDAIPGGQNPLDAG